METNVTKDKLSKAKELFSAKDYRAAIKLLENLENDRILHPKVLVLKYLCMSLMDGDAYSLEESKSILNRALKLDSDYLPAIIELAYLRLNVFDNPEEAIHLFEKATEMIKDVVNEVILGHAQCITELNGFQTAISFIQEQQKNLISPLKLEEFMDYAGSFDSGSK